MGLRSGKVGLTVALLSLLVCTHSFQLWVARHRFIFGNKPSHKASLEVDNHSKELLNGGRDSLNAKSNRTAELVFW